MYADWLNQAVKKYVGGIHFDVCKGKMYVLCIAVDMAIQWSVCNLVIITHVINSQTGLKVNEHGGAWMHTGICIDANAHSSVNTLIQMESAFDGHLWPSVDRP